MSRAEFEPERRRSDSARAKGRLTFTRMDVIRAGTRLLDTEGVEKLSMRKLANTLGTGSSTLYWHVRDKDELLLLILDETLREVTVPAAGTWDVRLLETLVRCHEALLPRPALVDVLWRAAWELGPETLRVADALTGLVAESGLPDDEVGDSYMALITLLFGFVAGERTSPGNPRYSEARAEGETAGSGPPYPNLMRYAPGAGVETMARQFRYAVERFITGIKLRVAEHERAADAPRSS
ncbi:TetR/AcrR family transcriptional regulator [Streptosporangium amethystogenes]|uniref:TetR/AcrR family transcriptional regulator n=1 Tax=Streptosporangium amethystogenes TaxID=2002 RepID=UPI0012F88CF1|nr:TetR family transcriptional regulator [Streptosporangium amethystogenes]